jgi:2-oxoglutarate dehydrogenase E1 component
MPDTLTIWEAQFGDFSNGAQVITDQYICSAEEKWRVMNNLVLYLPHGYEGQGPEHSSARIERFLSICGHLNIQVVNITTPANLFHALRRQLHRDIRKPLIVFTPKSLLRHPRCISSLGEMTSGGFKEVIDDSAADPKKITKLVFCSGKVYYDILQKREENEKYDVALIRIEQIYPFPHEQILEILNRYPMAAIYEWVQEEPSNMGAWNFIRNIFSDANLNVVARPSSGSTATGSSQLHKIQQNLLAEKALGMCTCEHAHGSCKLECAV